MKLTAEGYYVMNIELDFCEHILGYSFNDKSIGLQALQMSSAIQFVSYGGKLYRVSKNSRLATIGDKVLDYVLAKEWYPTGHTNGIYDGIRQAQASNKNLSCIGQELGLATCILHGAGGEASANMMADTVEALIGAVHIDGGWEAAERVIRKLGLLNHPHLANAQVGRA